MREQRIAALQEMLNLNSEDEFALYGLALEYKASGRLEDALPLLKRAAALPDPEVYTFYQLGEVLMGLAEEDEAVIALEEGLERATAAGNAKAANEFAALLGMIQ